MICETRLKDILQHVGTTNKSITSPKKLWRAEGNHLVETTVYTIATQQTVNKTVNKKVPKVKIKIKKKTINMTKKGHRAFKLHWTTVQYSQRFVYL